MCRRPASPINTSRLGPTPMQPRGQQAVDLLGRKIRQDFHGRFGNSRIGIEGRVEEHRPARCVAGLLQPPDRSNPHVARAVPRGLEQRIAGFGIGAIGQCQQQQSLLCGDAGPARSTARRSLPGAETSRVNFRPKAKHFLSADFKSSTSLEARRNLEREWPREPPRNPPLGNVGFADQLVQTNGVLLVSFGQVLFRAANDCIGDLVTDGWRCGANAFSRLGWPLRPQCVLAMPRLPRPRPHPRRRAVSPAPTARASRRTPRELITPINRRPFSVPSASRSASSQAGSGIASSAIRAQEESSSSAR